MSIATLKRKSRRLNAVSLPTIAWKTTNSSAHTGRLMRCCDEVVHDPSSPATHCGSQSGSTYTENSEYIADKVKELIDCTNTEAAEAAAEAALLSDPPDGGCVEQFVTIGGRNVPYSNTVKNLSVIDSTRAHAMTYEEYMKRKLSKSNAC